LCPFGPKPDNPRSYKLSLEQIKELYKEMAKQPFTELHIVDGVSVHLTGNRLPRPRLQMSVEETILRLRDAGLSSILGGGAEIFEEIR
jgi:aminodeoxyfutalosine synthase